MSDPEWMKYWTPADSRQAASEGWDLFDCEGSENGTPQLQTSENLEGEDVFTDDGQAWMWVKTNASLGGALHQKALILCREYNFDEYEAIMLEEGDVEVSLPTEF